MKTKKQKNNFQPGDLVKVVNSSKTSAKRGFPDPIHLELYGIVLRIQPFIPIAEVLVHLQNGKDCCFYEDDLKKVAKA